MSFVIGVENFAYYCSEIESEKNLNQSDLVQ